MAPVLQACLPKSSIARTFPHNVIYGPKEDGGLGQINLFVKQGTSKIAMLTEHLAMDSMTGDLLRCSIESAKIEIGVGQNIFELDFDWFGFLSTDSIIKFIWQFAHRYNIRIKDTVTPNLELRRANDVFLMEQFTLEDFTETELQHINRCRIYLQATTLADIMDGHGKRITQDALKCVKDKHRPAYYNWPLQVWPGQRARQLWKRAVKKAFPRIPGSLEVQHQLNHWVDTYNDWKWYLQQHTKLLYQLRRDGSWHMYRPTNRVGRTGRYPQYNYMAAALRFRPIAVGIR